MVTLTVEGMKCKHCQAKVKKVVEAIAEGVTCDVDLEAKTAKVEGTEDVEAMKAAIAGAGFEVVAVQ